MNISKIIISKVNRAPQKPGVYIFFNKKDAYKFLYNLNTIKYSYEARLYTGKFKSGTFLSGAGGREADNSSYSK